MGKYSKHTFWNVAIHLVVILTIATIIMGASSCNQLAYADNKESAYMGEFEITAYCGCRKCNGIWTGYPSASGAPLKEGITIAVDPKIIPLGTRVYIEGVGWRVAQDTGGMIKGNRIDVYIDSHSECLKFGRREMTVWVERDSAD